MEHLYKIMVQGERERLHWKFSFGKHPRDIKFRPYSCSTSTPCGRAAVGRRQTRRRIVNVRKHHQPFEMTTFDLISSAIQQSIAQPMAFSVGQSYFGVMLCVDNPKFD